MTMPQLILNMAVFVAKLANFSHCGQFLWPHYRDLLGEMQAELLDVLRIARYGIDFAVGKERERGGL